MKPFFSVCIKLLGLYFGCRAVLTLFSFLPSLIFSRSFSTDVWAMVTTGILPLSLQIAVSLWLIFRTDWVLTWARFPDARVPDNQALDNQALDNQMPNVGAQTLLEIGIILIGLLILVRALGDLLGSGLSLFVRPYNSVTDLRPFLPNLLTTLLAFGLLRFPHKLAALTRRQSAPAETK